jgi:hypothetical protein
MPYLQDHKIIASFVKGQPITFGLQVLIDTLEPKLSLGKAKWSLIVPWGELYVLKIESSIQKIIMLIPHRLLGPFHQLYRCLYLGLYN